MEEELKFILSTEAQGSEATKQSATSAIQQVGKVFTEVRSNVQKAAADTKNTLNAIVNSVSSAATDMSNRLNGMSLAGLQNEFIKIEEQIQKQEAVFRQAEQAFEEMAEWNKQFNGDEYNSWLATLGDEANKAEEQLRALKEQQQQVAAAINIKTNAAQQIEETNAQLSATKQSGAQAKMGLDAVANGLSVVGRATGGVGSNIAAIAMEVRYLKQAYTSTAATAGSSAATMSAAFGAVGIAVTAVVMVISAIANAAEEAKRKLKETREEIEELRGGNIGASKLIGEYEEISQKAVKSADDTKRMLEIRAELVETYGFAVSAVDEEGRLLAGNLEIMKEQLQISRQLLLTQLEANKSAEEKAYKEALRDRERYQLAKALAEAQAKKLFRFDTPDPKKYDIEIEKAEKEAKRAIESLFQQMVMSAQAGGQEVSEELQIAISSALSKALEKAFAEGTEFTTEQAEALMQSIIDAFNALDALVADTDIPGLQAVINKMMVDMTGKGVDTQAAADSINALMDAIFAGADEAVFERAEELKRRILAGLASPEEMDEYNALMEQINRALAGAMADASGAERRELFRLRGELVMTSDELIEFANRQEAANMSLEDAASRLRSVAGSFKSVSAAIDEAAKLKGAYEAIKAYLSAGEKTAEMQQAYADAKAYLAEQYGVEEDAVAGMLPTIKDDIELKEALALADYQVALASAYAALATIQSMIAMGSITQTQGQLMVNALQDVINKLTQLGSTRITVGGVKASGDFQNDNKVTSSGGGGGGSRNKALDNAIAQLDHYRAMDQLTTAEEIANLERILAKYAKTTAEKRKLTEELYALRKQKAEEDLEYQEAMDQLTLREKIAAMDAMIASHKAGTDARRDLEKQRYEAARELEKQEFDLKVHYGQLTLTEQEAYIKALIASYKEGVQARIELEKQLFDVQQSLRQKREDELSALADAVTEAFRARYEAMREDETETLQASIEAWKEWGDAQTEALQAQIAALDELTKQENDAEIEAAKRRKVAALEQQLQYEQDAYNRRKLAEQLAAAQSDLDSWLTQKEREAQKAALQAQIDGIKTTVDEQTAALEDQIDAVDAYYDQLTEDARLQAEAQRLIMQGSQEEILAMLQSYASDYNLTGKSLGEQWLDGFLGAVGGSFEAWFDGLTERFAAFQTQLASAATAAADEYYASRGASSTTLTTENYNKVISPVINITINGSGADSLMTPSERQELVDEIVAAMSNM